jgi:hypothetical protein
MKTDVNHRTSRYSYVMTRTNFGDSELPDENRDGPRNFGLLTLQPPDAAASSRIFHWSIEPVRI